VDGLLDDVSQDGEFLAHADERDHDLGHGADLALEALDGGLGDGAGLHAGDLGVGDGETAAAVAEHRVDLVEVGDAALRSRGSCPSFLARASSSCFSWGRNSWSGGSSRRMVTGRPFIAVKMPMKSSRW
jgi:hypothetical protein